MLCLVRGYLCPEHQVVRKGAVAVSCQVLGMSVRSLRSIDLRHLISCSGATENRTEAVTLWVLQTIATVVTVGVLTHLPLDSLLPAPFPWSYLLPLQQRQWRLAQVEQGWTERRTHQRLRNNAWLVLKVVHSGFRAVLHQLTDYPDVMPAPIPATRRSVESRP